MPDPSLVSALAARYRITRELGAGGMATVYLADDLRHQRQVAIKVLRPELSAALGADRFLREITTTANLRHPHILPLYDSGTEGGFLYYVMPFVEGETLRDRMERESQLPIADAIRIADEIADALAYAHGAGVIHRDIKPENILLENGRAIVADFGIAHALNASGTDKLTMTGMSLGTPHYMSPEQASGDTVDGRSDLYALACLTYEMLAGTPPFTGPNAMAIMARHMTDPVPRLATVRPTVAATVADAIARALAKTPADRFTGITEWREAMRRVASAAAAAEPTPAFHKPPPTPATPLLGREADLTAAAERLQQGAHVLTVTGVGGTGKTRLAMELFQRLQGDYAGGAAFVSLASVTSASDVMPTISATLDIAEAHGRSALDALATVIGAQPVLLVLDNLEQVVDAATDIATLVSRCAGLRVIATSRQPLKIGAESELALAPLGLPEAGATEADELMHFPAVALFVQRAEKVKPGFTLSAANAVSIAAICRSLDGLPLALELAAARVRILEPAMLLQRLDHALDLLSSGDRDLPLRQRTLRATISWSYSLLDEPEKLLLRRLSVFHEGWTLDAMEQVCFAPDDRWSAVDGLESLVEKGLVRVLDGGQRYSLLETIRAFAAEQLHAGGEVDEVRSTHAAYFEAFTEEVARGIHGTTQLADVARAKADLANAHAAIAWCTARARAGDAESLERGLALCAHLNWFWHIAGHHLTARIMVGALVGMAKDNAPTRARAGALYACGMISTVTGEWDRSLVEATAGYNDAIALNDDRMAAEGLLYIGYCHLHDGRMAESQAALDEAIVRSANGVSDFVHAICMSMKGMLLYATGELDAGMALVKDARVIQERLGDCEGGGMALSFLASMTFAKGDLDGSLALYANAEETLERVGDKPEIARVRCEMGYAALSGGKHELAQHHFRRALRTYDEIGSPRGAGQALFGLAAIESARDNPERAVTIAAAAQVMSERAGAVVDHPMAPGMVEKIAALRAAIPKQQLDALMASGSALTPAAVLEMVAA